MPFASGKLRSASPTSGGGPFPPRADDQSLASFSTSGKRGSPRSGSTDDGTKFVRQRLRLGRRHLLATSLSVSELFQSIYGTVLPANECTRQKPARLHSKRRPVRIKNSFGRLSSASPITLADTSNRNAAREAGKHCLQAKKDKGRGSSTCRYFKAQVCRVKLSNISRHILGCQCSESHSCLYQ